MKIDEIDQIDEIDETKKCNRFFYTFSPEKIFFQIYHIIALLKFASSNVVISTAMTSSNGKF